MLNPYTFLSPEILAAMLKQPMYFVRQEYKRGCMAREDNETISFLLTHYAHHEIDKERAERHMRLLMKDQYRFLYDSTKEEHKNKLLKAATQPYGYRIYINLLPKKWKASDSLKRKINSYMLHRLSWWKYSPADKLKVTLKERYGELYIALLWKGQQTEVHLDEIENFIPCAMT
jgi:hypothetical protein